jgi:DNA-binding response OmpR family regulator
VGTGKILLIESARIKHTSFADALKRHYEVISVPSGRQAISTARSTLPQVIVLNAISLRTPGDRICRLLRDHLAQTPIIHLHDGPKNGLDTPADIALVPPFTARKLINSIERLIQVGEDEIVSCGPFSFNLGRRVLVANGQETQLTPKLARLVEIFLRHPGQILERKTLMEEVWQTDYLGDTRTLDVHIRWIRQAIEADAGSPRYLKTVRGVGYRLDVPESAALPVAQEAVLALS